MALEDDIRILQRVALLEGFTPEQLRLLAFGAESLRIRAGRDLYAEGADADCAYVVATGEIELYRESEGKRTVTGRAGPGALLGELALIAGGTRPTSAVAVHDTEVIRLGRTIFRRILEEYPELAAVLHRRIAGQLEAMVGRLDRVRKKYGG
jgi:CRP-like cAMP-binding protein